MEAPLSYDKGAHTEFDAGVQLCFKTVVNPTVKWILIVCVPPCTPSMLPGLPGEIG